LGAWSEIDSLIAREYRVDTLTFPPDYEGPVRATLISRRSADSLSGRAVLYIHGFGDYFFQTHLADWYRERGFHFHALDLRKYGRSWLPHQRPNFAKDLREYFAEIDQAIDSIVAHGHDTLLLNGHSTGGLIAALYCVEGARRRRVDALFLNSPFFDFNADARTERVAGWIATSGAWRPYGVFSGGDTSLYNQGLHREYGGRWDFNLRWKPLISFPVYLGWLRAVHQGHRRVQAGLDLPIPILVLHSDRSFQPDDPPEARQYTDAVLDVTDIARYAQGLGAQVEVEEAPGAVHDLFLSAPETIQAAFETLEQWLARIGMLHEVTLPTQ
jgi:alpha-beta hydrolase superfamily lysophospholipase